MFDQSNVPKGVSGLPPKSFQPQATSALQPASHDSCSCPATTLSSADIDKVCRVLEHERFGINYRDLLARLAQSPWTFSDGVDLRSSAVTIKLIECNPELHREYNDRLRLERETSHWFSWARLFGWWRQSNEFVASQCHLNQIVEDMCEVGLLKIQEFGPERVFTGDRLNPLEIMRGFWRISVGDLGNLALRS